jgi:peptidylprolyl isomerase
MFLPVLLMTAMLAVTAGDQVTTDSFKAKTGAEESLAVDTLKVKKAEATKMTDSAKAAVEPKKVKLEEGKEKADTTKAKGAVKKMSEKEITTASGLKYVDIKVGTGASPKKGDMVSVHYTGWLTNGKKFDSSVDRGQPFEFGIGLGQVIQGWDEGVMSMKVGGKRKLIIPAELAYGNRAVGGGLIPPNSTLIFEVELLGIK